YFGIIAIISFIISTGELFTDVGFSQAIIQKKDDLTRNQLSTIFFIKLFITFLTILVIYIISPITIKLIPHFTSQETAMIRILSLTLLAKPFETIFTSLLERELKYNILPFIDIVGV